MGEPELETLLLEHKNLIYAIMKYFPNYPNKDDLFQVGCIGLIDAYKHYTDEFHTKFSTYAYSYILGEMKKLVREDRGIKVSRTTHSLYLKIEKASILLSQKLMREPTITEISRFLEIDENLIVEAFYSSNALLDVDELPISVYDNLDEQLYLREELKELSSEELEILNRRYWEDRTQKETADILGMSQVQVSRKENKALQKLKSKLVA